MVGMRVQLYSFIYKQNIKTELFLINISKFKQTISFIVMDMIICIMKIMSTYIKMLLFWWQCIILNNYEYNYILIQSISKDGLSFKIKILLNFKRGSLCSPEILLHKFTLKKGKNIFYPLLVVWPIYKLPTCSLKTNTLSIYNPSCLLSLPNSPYC